MSQQQQAAYDAYQASKTEGTKIGLPGGAGAVSPDFVAFVENFEDIDPFTVNTDHLQGFSFSTKAFYQTLVATTFHTHYGNYNPPARGPGNNTLVQLQRTENGHYVITLIGLTQQNVVIELEEPGYHLNSNSIFLDEGVVKVIFKLTRHKVNGAPVYNFQVAYHDKLYMNYYLVPFELE